MIAVMVVAALTASAQKGEYFITPHITFGYAHINDAKTYVEEFGKVDLGSLGLGGIGVDFEYMVSDQVGLSAGLDFQYMMTDELVTGNTRVKATVYQDYSFMNIPLLVQYHMGGFAIKAGLQPTFLLSTDIVAEVRGVGVKEEHRESVKELMNTTGLAIPVGCSYTFRTPITLDLRCAIPVTRLNKKLYPGEDDIHITPITLSVGYTF